MKMKFEDKKKIRANECKWNSHISFAIKNRYSNRKDSHLAKSHERKHTHKHKHRKSALSRSYYDMNIMCGKGYTLYVRVTIYNPN